MNYVCVVGFETEQIDKETGKSKVKKAKFLVDGESLYEALMNMLEYLKEDARGYDIKSIGESRFEDIIHEKAGKVVGIN